MSKQDLSVVLKPYGGDRAKNLMEIAKSIQGIFPEKPDHLRELTGKEHRSLWGWAEQLKIIADEIQRPRYNLKGWLRGIYGNDFPGVPLSVPGTDEIGRPVPEICDDLNQLIREILTKFDDEDTLGHFEGFSNMKDRFGRADAIWPVSWRWISCYAVRGGSEGHYVHVDVIANTPRQEREMYLLTKTFGGWDHALLLADLATLLLAE